MKKTILTLLISMVALTSSATIINIPADYPAIQQGIDASVDGDTVLVQPGTYVENINFNGHNIALGSLFLTTGDTSYIGQTVIDGGGNESVVLFGNNDSSTVISGFTIKNGLALDGGGIRCLSSDPKITYNIIEDNFGDAGGGIFCGNSDALIIQNIIRGNTIISPLGSPGGGICCRYGSNCLIIYNEIYGNTNQDGGAIAVIESSPLISNNLVYGNTAIDLGGAIRSNYSAPIIMNNTIAFNSATTGGGIYFLYSQGAIAVNSIFWGDSAGNSDEIYIAGGAPAISYCDVEGGYQGQGNIDLDPLFRDPENADFHLMSTACGDSLDSPCIDAGSPYYSDSLLDCSWGLGGSRSDMGAYGGGDSLITAIFDDLPSTPVNFMLLQNYPNPFNARTTIRFILPKSQNIKLIIYDLLGRQIEVLIDEYREAGVHNIAFDAFALSSGVYFYRLRAGDAVETKRMVLLK